MRKQFWVLAGLVWNLAVMVPRPVCAQAPVVHERLTMDEAVDLALKQRPELQGVAEEVRREEAAIGQGSPALATTQAPFGVVSGLPTIFETSPPLQTKFLASSVFEQNPTLSKPLSNGPKVQREVASDLMGSEATRDELRAQVTEIMRTTRVQWLNAMLTGQKRDVYTDIVAKETEANQMAQTQFQAGNVPEVVIHRAKLELASSQQQLNNATCEASKALMDLKLAMGVDQASDISLNGKLNDQPLPLSDLDTLVQAALRQRPDLESARLELTRSELNSQERNATPAARLHTELLRSRTDAISQVVKRDVYKAYADVQTQVDNLNLTASAIEESQENYKIALLRFSSGRGIQLEVIDALAAMAKARVNRLEAACGYQAALVELNWAVGGVFNHQ